MITEHKVPSILVNQLDRYDEAVHAELPCDDTRQIIIDELVYIHKRLGMKSYTLFMPEHRQEWLGKLVQSDHLSVACLEWWSKHLDCHYVGMDTTAARIHITGYYRDQVDELSRLHRQVLHRLCNIEQLANETIRKVETIIMNMLKYQVEETYFGKHTNAIHKDMQSLFDYWRACL